MTAAGSAAVAALVCAAALLAGCTADQAGSGQAGAGTAPGPAAPAAPTAAGAPPITSDGNDRSEVRGQLRLQGTVRRVGDCLYLETAGRRIVVAGAPAAALRDAQRVVVEGIVTPPPASCPADLQLALTSATAS
jgi:hypothetical protein